MKFFTSLFLAAVVCAAPQASAQSGAATDAARQESVVQQAMQRYEQGLSRIDPTPRQAQPGALGSGGLRELRLEEAVSLALEKNLDIQVARLEPQSVDFQVAGFRNTYRPASRPPSACATSTSCPPAPSTAAPGQQRHRHLQLRPVAERQQVRRQLHGELDQLARRDVEHLLDVQSELPDQPGGAYTQPLMRGFRIDNTRQQLLVNLINRDISEESARATTFQTLANVRNAYWDLVFAQSAVEVAQRARGAGRQAGRRQPGARRSRHAGAARHRAGAGRGRDAPPEPGRRRSDGTDRRAGAEALHRQRHRRPAVAADDSSGRPALAAAAADRHRWRRAQGARRTHRRAVGAEEPGLERRQHALLPEPVAAGAGPERQLRRTGPRRHRLHPQRHRRRQPGHRHDPRRLPRCARRRWATAPTRRGT